MEQKELTEQRLVSLLERIIEEPWQAELSDNEQKYIDLLQVYKEKGGDYNEFCEKYVGIINLKELRRESSIP